MLQLTKKELPIIEVKQETPTTKTITLAIGAVTFSYQPSSYIGLTLNIKNPDEKGSIRAFSLASSPTEKGKLIVASRTGKSAFKHAFAELKTGDTVKVSGPFGRFLLHENHHRPAVMLSGGIGITPLRSMIKYATDKKLPLKITLFYSNTTPEEIMFKTELDSMQKQNKNLNIIYTITKSEASTLQWNGNRGRITAEMIKPHIPDLKESIFYICGPSSMVRDLYALLTRLDVSPEHIKVENFTGYE